jgi:hypothetical protein
MSFGLRDELLNLKTKLENLESELTNQMMDLEVKAEEWHKRDEEVSELAKKNKDVIITLDIGGKKFQTKLETLLSLKDTLFYKIFLSNRLDLKQEIFIDRNYDNFHYILSYLRNKKLITTSLTNPQIQDLLEEAKFYEIGELVEILEEMLKEVKYVNFEFNGEYVSSGRKAGTNNIEDLNDFEDRTMRKGICATHPGWIIIELNREIEFDCIEVGGWNGDTGIWGNTNGSGAQIMTSTDKTSWNQVGTLPNNFGALILPVNVTRTKAKYVKFQHNSYLGIGYFKIKKL